MKQIFGGLLLTALLAGCVQAPAAPVSTATSTSAASSTSTTGAAEYLSTAQVTKVGTCFDWEEIPVDFDLTELSELLHQAADSLLPEEETADLTRNEFWWAELELDQGTLEANVLAGTEQEGLIYFRYTDAQGERTEFYADAPELALQLRQCWCREGQVDREMLSLVQDAIDQEAQVICQAKNGGVLSPESPEFTGGQVADFAPYRSYDDLTDGTVYLYTLDLALTCNHPERIGLAGGIWVDDQGRLRDNYQLAYMEITLRDGQVVHTTFFAEDALGGESEDQEENIRSCLLWALEQPSNEHF